MLMNSIMFIFLILFSFLLFFINNIYILIGLLTISIMLSIIFHVHLPIYLPFIILLGINFIFNFLLSSMEDALIVTIRLIVMFIVVNLIVKKMGIMNLGKVIGLLTRCKELELMILICLSFIPIMAKEIKNIKDSLNTKNCPLNFKNILTRPYVFVLTFFNNLFRRVNEMEKVFIARGIDE